jgi:excinuclease ABC subunit A
MCSTSRCRKRWHSSPLTRGVPAPGALGRRGVGLPAARAAGSDAVGRRSPAPQARRSFGRERHARPNRRARRRSANGDARKPSLVPVRRTHHRPAFRRCRQTAARVSAAASRPATRCWSSNTTSTWCAPPTGSSTWAPRAATPAAPSSASVRPRGHARRRLAHRPRAARSGESRPPLAVRAVHIRASSRTRAASVPNAIEIRGAREHNLKNVDVNLGLNKFTVITGVSGSGKSTLAFDILFAEGQRRYLESLERLCAAVRAARVAAGRRRHIRHTAHRGHRAAHQPRRPQEHRGDAHRDLSLPAPAVREAGGAILPHLQFARIEPQSADAIAARILKDYRGKRITLLAPLIVARKGLYTALAKWARGKGFKDLRWTAACCPRPSGRGWIASSNTTSNCPSPRLTINAAGRSGIARAILDVALEHGRGVVHVAKAESKEAAAVRRTSVSTKRACPKCGTGFPRARSALFSFNSKHGWCKTCFGTGLQMEEFDAEQSGEESKWREDEPPPKCLCGLRRRALESGRAHVLFRGQSIAALTELPVQEFEAA